MDKKSRLCLCVARRQEGLLPFKIEQSKEPLMARGGLILPYEVARALKLPVVIDKELPSPGSGHAYKPSQFVMPFSLCLTGDIDASWWREEAGGHERDKG